MHIKIGLYEYIWIWAMLLMKGFLSPSGSTVDVHQMKKGTLIVQHPVFIQQSQNEVFSKRWFRNSRMIHSPDCENDAKRKTLDTNKTGKITRTLKRLIVYFVFLSDFSKSHAAKQTPLITKIQKTKDSLCE